TRMPPSGKLSEKEIKVLSRWVEIGAPWPSNTVLTSGKPADKASTWWSFQPIRQPPLPEVKYAQWLRAPIDRFILAELEKQNLQPAAAADKRTLIRRATFDLIGLPPTPEEIDAYLSDQSTEAFAKVVDRLLASPHYGQRWGRHWLDLVRYTDSFDARILTTG